ncbi:MAG: geranylgeranylglycerol-phosphate geranylgeranyltransferase [Bacteroidia bacterium]|nr:geranylgeranylglycerol-phosphate geranylgeranyltransferase [Bacteroidia bacterium]
MTSVKVKYRILIIKIFALLSIVRWQNIVLTLVAQYLAAVYILNPNKNYLWVLSNHKLHLMALASAFIIAGGYIINSFYDLEKDLVNRPDKTLFGRIISRRFCLNCYFLFNTIGLILAISASFRIFLFFLMFAILLWMYSHKFQKIPFVREISASILSVMSFFAIGIFYKYITIPLFLYGCFAMFIIFSREILKDIEAYMGNNIFGYGTYAGKLGIDKSALSIIIINFSSLLPLGVIVCKYNFLQIGISFAILVLLLNIIVFKLIYKNRNFQKNAEIIHKVYKFFLLIIISLVILVR